MKLTTREIRLMALLGVLLLLAAYVNLFLKPQLAAISKLREEISKDRDSYNLNLSVKEKVKNMGTDVKILMQKLKDLRTVFPPVVNYDEILLVVRDQAKRAGLQIESLNFTDAVEAGSAASSNKNNEAVAAGKQNGTASGNVQITDDSLKKALANLGMGDGNSLDGSKTGQGKALIPDGKGYSVSIKVNAKGTNSQVKAFINNILGLKNKMAFKDVQISNSGGGQLTANMTLEMYGIMDRNAEEYTMLYDSSLAPPAPEGKENVFSPFEGFVGQISSPGGSGDAVSREETDTGKPLSLEELQAYDFSLGALPYGESLAPPSVSITAKHLAAGDGTFRIPIIYGDSKGEEKAEIYVEEKDGRFYCKYKTGNEAFPDPAYKQLAEFKPAGDEIQMIVNSTPRKFNEDKNSVSIGIINKTSKAFIVRVVDEDKSQPRVKIDKTEGDVKVEYK
ncbi:MAG: hypothetical protein QHH06_02040 [Clostridiales bacterium]|nr:hypothetical protein [Eubacteriales bacterium]MDH7565252.1 hypothetical protein [Clostridiales bacterium]